MRLSVLSALARMDVDPWKEATRLAAMPKAIAETTLVSTLNRVARTIWKPSEAEVIAARLVRLLPQKNEKSDNYGNRNSRSPFARDELLGGVGSCRDSGIDSLAAPSSDDNRH